MKVMVHHLDVSPVGTSVQSMNGGRSVTRTIGITVVVLDKQNVQANVPDLVGKTVDIDRNGFRIDGRIIGCVQNVQILRD